MYGQLGIQQILFIREALIDNVNIYFKKSFLVETSSAKQKSRSWNAVRQVAYHNVNNCKAVMQCTHALVLLNKKPSVRVNYP